MYIETEGGQQTSVAEPSEKAAHYPEPTMFGTTPAYGFFIRNLRNLEMSFVELAFREKDVRPAIYLDTVERADFFAISAPVYRGGAFSLHNVKDFRVGWSRATGDKNLPEVENLNL